MKLAKKKQMPGRPPEIPRYVPKSKGKCGITSKGKDLGGCGQPVYKGAVRYKKALWHATCLVSAIKKET